MTTDQNAAPTVPAPSELDLLKERAKQLGITHHPSIGLEKLREKVNAHLADKPPETATAYADTATMNQAPVAKEETELEKASRLRREASKLIRVIVTCRNPNKSEWEGEIFTTGNSYVGSIKKYVPFNNENGWHVPVMIYNMMKERKCQIFVNGKNGRGEAIKIPKEIPEFAIEVLDPLTPAELDELARQQAMSHSIDN